MILGCNMMNAIENRHKENKPVSQELFGGLLYFESKIISYSTSKLLITFN